MPASPGKAGPVKTFPTVGVCGLDCGLCPRYYTAGPSRCPGCGGPCFFDKHPSCSFITCCVKKRGLEVCGQCEDFPCPKFKSEEEYSQIESSPSYPPYRNVLRNLRLVKTIGIREFARRQEERIGLLERMIRNYDDGRSRSFYCRAAALLAPNVLRASLAEADRTTNTRGVRPSEIKTRAKVLQGILEGAALREEIGLKSQKRR
jgi:hypothetical protein